MRHSFLAAAALLALVAACDDPTPSSGPGTVTAALVSPNGPEGAAVLDVTGTVEGVSGSNDVSVYTTPTANGTRVVVVRINPGALEMSLKVADVSRPPAVSVVEVADGDDRLRSTLSGYRVEFR